MSRSDISGGRALVCDASPQLVRTPNSVMLPLLASSVGALAGGSAYAKIKAASCSPLDGCDGKKSLVVLLPQLGEFDSFEFVEQLNGLSDDLDKAKLNLRIVGIGSESTAKRFCDVSGLDPALLSFDPDGSLHRELGLHAGPGWSPDFFSDGLRSALLSTLPGGCPSDPALVRPVFDAWLNYLAMCAGIAAPGTLPEILRGYFGDKSAPERLAPDAVVSAGPIEIGPGVGPVKLGPIKYSNSWAGEEGYQRPVELATVRLRHMVEVLSHWDAYVSNPTAIAQRGATYIFDEDGNTLYEYRHRGVLTYSATMSRPCTFLAPFVGAKALNPLGLGDASVASAAAATVAK